MRLIFLFIIEVKVFASSFPPLLNFLISLNDLSHILDHLIHRDWSFLFKLIIFIINFLSELFSSIVHTFTGFHIAFKAREQILITVFLGFVEMNEVFLKIDTLRVFFLDFIAYKLCSRFSIFILYDKNFINSVNSKSISLTLVSSSVQNVSKSESIFNHSF